MDEEPIVADIKRGVRLDASRFSIYLHNSRQGDRPHDLWDFKTHRPQPGWTYVGWCPSAATSIPDTSWSGIKHHVAVLLMNSREEEVWLHVPVSQEMLNQVLS